MAAAIALNVFDFVLMQICFSFCFLFINVADANRKKFIPPLSATTNRFISFPFIVIAIRKI
jgi:hypothetical protein